MIYLNSNLISPTIFPDGTSQVWKLKPGQLSEEVIQNITWEFENENELIHLAQLRELLSGYVILSLPYLPYGRQDKPVGNDNTFALHAFAKLLNAMKFDRIDIFDPHSDEAFYLIKNSQAISPMPWIFATICDMKPDLILYPDKGAQKRYLISSLPHIVGEKIRNQNTGEIIDYKIDLSSTDLKGASVLIVDDICDGGRTFIEASKILLIAGARKVFLYTSHGIYSKGLMPLFEAGISKIICKGTIFNEPTSLHRRI